MAQNFPSKPAGRQGLTLVELLVGVMLAAMVSAGLSVLSQHAMDVTKTVERVSQSNQVSLAVDRYLTNRVKGSVKTSFFPGYRVVPIDERAVCLAIRVSGKGDEPMQKEMVFVSFSPSKPNELREFSGSGGTKLPALNLDSDWNAVASGIVKGGGPSELITDQLATTVERGTTIGLFSLQQISSPSAVELQSHADGFTAWEDLPWPQGRSGDSYGIKQQNTTAFFFVSDDKGNAIPSFWNFSQLATIQK